MIRRLKIIPISVPLLFLLSLASPASATTHITGTFKTAGNLTPAQAGLRTVATIGATPVYGTVDLVPLDGFGRRVAAIVCNSITYIPQNVRGWIKGDGTLIAANETAGVDVIPTLGCQPVGLVYRATISLAGSVDGNLAPISYNENKQVPDQPTVDWAALPIAALQQPAFSGAQVPSTIEVTQPDGINLHMICDSGCTGSGGGGGDMNLTQIGGVAVGATNGLYVRPGTGATFPVSGTFFQATQPVSGTFWQTTQPVSIASMPSTPVTGTFFQATQPVSVADGSEITLGAKADAKSTATDTTAVSIEQVLKEISFMEQNPASRAVTGTFWQATQPVSGTFWQATQPVSGTVTVIQGTGTNLHTVCDSGCTPGGSFSDSTAFSFGSSAINPMGAVVDDVSTNTVAENSAGTPRMSGSRILYVDLSKTTANGTAIKVDGSAVTQPVSGTFWQTTQPVSGTFWQTTQPVSGTFFQATQPVSVADGSLTTLGAKADAKSTATDTTSVSAMQVFKEMSAMLQAPASTPVTNSGLSNLDVALSTRALESGGNLAAIKTDVDKIPASPATDRSTAAAPFSMRLSDGAAFYKSTTPSDTQPVSVADGSEITLGAKADAKSTATDTTAVSLQQVLKEISFMEQNPASRAVTGTFWQATQPVSGTFWQATQPISGAVSFTAPQHTICDAGCTPGGSFSDNTAFSPGSTALNIAGGVYNDGLSAVTSGNAAAPRITEQRGIHVNLRTEAGAEISPAKESGGNLDAIEADMNAMLAWQSLGFRLRGSFNQPISSTNGAMDVNVKIPPASADPCAGKKTTNPISQTASSKIVSGMPGMRIYTCFDKVIAQVAEIPSFTEGIGNVCGTNTLALDGSTTAANGDSIAAQGGWVEGTGGATVMATNIPGNDLCLPQSGSNRITGKISYVYAP